MATHTVLIPNKTVAKDVDAYVRPAICASALDNGSVFQLLTKSGTTGESEVWNATAPTSSSAANVWMAGEPELPFATVGTNRYNTLGTIRDFYNSACAVFTAFKPQKGDIITMTPEAFDSSTTAAYAITVTGAFTLEWNATAPSSGFGLKYLGSKYIPFTDGSISGSRLLGFECEVYSV